MQSLYSLALPVCLLSGVLAAQQVRADVMVTSEVVAEVEFQGVAPLDRRVLPVGTIIGQGLSRSIAADSGGCTAAASVEVRTDMDSVIVTAHFVSHLPTRTTGRTARSSTQADLVIDFRSPLPANSVLWVVLDTMGSRGPAPLGDLFVDVGNDGSFEYANGGPCACRTAREFLLPVGPNTGSVRVLHMGTGLADNTEDCDYRAVVQMTFVPGSGAVVSHREGCHPLRYSRWIHNVANFDFTRPPAPNELFFLMVGPVAHTPPPASQVPGLLCALHTTPVVTRMQPWQVWWFEVPLLPQGSALIVQGAVLGSGSIRPTDSYLIR